MAPEVVARGNGPGRSAGTGTAALTVVVPAYQEERRLPATLRRIDTWLGEREEVLPAELVVVDDGSTDDTAAVTGRIRWSPGLTARTVRLPRNRGKGAAVRAGFAASSGRRVLLTDADLSAPIEDLPRLLGAGEGVVAIGSRAVDRRLIEVRQPWHRDAMGRCFNLAVRTLLLRDLGDTQCGFKLFPGRLARSLAAAAEVDGFAFDVEMLVLARTWGVPVIEVPVRWSHVEASRVDPLRHSPRMLADVLRLWVRSAAGRLAAPPAAAEDGP